MKNQHLISILLLLFLFSQAAFSQPICGFDEVHRKKMKEDPQYQKNMIATEARIQEYIGKHRAGLFNSPPSSGNRVAAALFTIPVVVHVVHTGGAIGSIYNPTNAQIAGVINYLNQVYDGTFAGIEGVGDIQIQFALASRDPNCNATTGIDRIDGSALTNYVSNGVNNSTAGGVSDLALKNFDRWDPSSYYNIWVVNKIDAKDGTSGQFVAGYAYFAGAPASFDGTVMLATQMVSGLKTLPHEIGHALNLYHTFEGSALVSNCPAVTAGGCTVDGDKVCDTDPISENINASNVIDFSCRAGTNSCTGTAYSINTEHNYMNYTTCFTLFTAGQKARMLAAMSLADRASLVSSWSLGGAYPITPFVAPVAASCTPVTSATGLSGDFAGLIGVAAANKAFSSDAAGTDGGYRDNTNKCLYLIPMQKNSTYTFSATVLAVNHEQVRAWIDYNNDGVFSNATEQIYFKPDINSAVSDTTVSGTFTVPASAIINTTLRMRVLNELGTFHGFAIPNACYNPTYGQAEDFPVYLTAALPVKLEYFNGRKQNNDVLLSWKTSFEQNAASFRIERSLDGVSFNEIGIVATSSISNGSSYAFTDKNVTGTKIYYRLNQVDKDQKNEYSEIIVITLKDITSSSFKVANNPFTDKLDIIFSKIQNGKIDVRLIDVTGKEIYRATNNLSGQSQMQMSFAGKNISAGIYFLQVKTGQAQFIEKVIKQ